MSHGSKQSIQAPPDGAADEALNQFFAITRTASRENSAAVANAKPALARIAAAITGRDSGQALRVRSILISFYTGGAVANSVTNT